MATVEIIYSSFNECVFFWTTAIARAAAILLARAAQVELARAVEAAVAARHQQWYIALEMSQSDSANKIRSLG
jgi:hypothetical protein